MNSEWLIGGAAIAALSAGWGYVRALWQYLTSWLVVRAELDVELSDMLGLYLKHRQATPSKFGKRTYGYVAIASKAREFSDVLFEYWFSGRVVWLGRWPLLMGMTSNSASANQAPGTTNGASARVSVCAIRGTIDIEYLLHEAIKLVANKRRGNASRYHIRLHYGQQQRRAASSGLGQARGATAGGPPYTSQFEGRCYELPGVWKSLSGIGEQAVVNTANLTLADLVLDAEAQSAVQLIRAWRGNEDWYKARSIAWQLGICLYGEPGNGKSTFIKTVASELKLPVHVLDLTTMDNLDLHEAWTTAQNTAPAVVVIEDFHSVFIGDKPVGSTGVTMDALLQHFSGLDGTDGLLLFVTTNVIEHMSPALLRPGRLDLHVEMRAPDDAGRTKLATRVLRDQPELIEGIVRDSAGFSCVKVQQMCTELALSLQHQQVLGEANGEFTVNRDVDGPSSSLADVCTSSVGGQEAGTAVG